MKPSSIPTAILVAVLFMALAPSTVRGQTAGQVVPIAVYLDTPGAFGVAYDPVNDLIHYTQGDLGDTVVHTIKPYKNYTPAETGAFPVVGGVQHISLAAGLHDVAGTTAPAGFSAHFRSLAFDTASGQLVMQHPSLARLISFDPLTGANVNPDFAPGTAAYTFSDGLDVDGGDVWYSGDVRDIDKNGALFASQLDPAVDIPAGQWLGLGTNNTLGWSGVEHVQGSVFAVAVQDFGDAGRTRTIVRFDAATGALLGFDPDGDPVAARWEDLAYDGEFLYAADLRGNANSTGVAGDIYVFGVTGGLAIEPTLTPELDLNEPGTDHTVTLTLEDGNGDPVEGVEVAFSVVSGPNAGASGTCTFNADCTTDANGMVFFTYSSDGSIGVDTIVASFEDEDGETIESNTVLKFWDLDCQQNDVPDTCDLDCSGFGGLCDEYASCGGSSDTNGDGVPDECNTPPDCSLAGAEPDELWPPNTKFKPVTVGGVTDEDGDPVAITVDSIHQDEPLIGQGSGNFSPDGAGLGSDTALVRVERTGWPDQPGDGRVYHIAFTADDGRGGACTGAVTVCVPHDMRRDHECIDGGPLYDSTQLVGGNPKPLCGFSYEVAVLIPALMWLRRRQRRRKA